MKLWEIYLITRVDCTFADRFLANRDAKLSRKGIQMTWSPFLSKIDILNVVATSTSSTYPHTDDNACVCVCVT